MTITPLTEVPCTLLELSAAGAVDGDVYLGLLRVILAIINVPNGTRISLGVVVTCGEPVEFRTHGGGNVHWSRTAVVRSLSVCTITLLLAIIAADQHVPFVCVNPIGSHLLVRGGNITFGNYGCRAGRVGRRRIVLGPAVRTALLQKLADNGEGDGIIRMLDTDENVQLREHLTKRRHAKATYEEEYDEEVEVGVMLEVVENDDAGGAAAQLKVTKIKFQCPRLKFGPVPVLALPPPALDGRLRARVAPLLQSKTTCKVCVRACADECFIAACFVYYNPESGSSPIRSRTTASSMPTSTAFFTELPGTTTR
jgi:hypothetical protein